MNTKGLLIPLLLWIILTVIYGGALFAFRNYEVLSFIYHLGLLAIALWCAKGILKNGLGLRIGNFKYGILICLGFVGYLLLYSFIRGWPQFAFALNLATFSTVIIGPIIEEIFWRGLIFQRMQKTKLDVSVVILTNASFFALMHIPRILFFNETPIMLFALLGSGAIFAITYYLTKSVYYSTVEHILQNIFSVF